MSAKRIFSYSVIKALPDLSLFKKNFSKNKIFAVSIIKSNIVLNALSEISKNCLANNINFSQQELKKLRRVKRLLIFLSKKGNYEQKYSILSQKRYLKQIKTILDILLPILTAYHE